MSAADSYTEKQNKGLNALNNYLVGKAQNHKGQTILNANDIICEEITKDVFF